MAEKGKQTGSKSLIGSIFDTKGKIIGTCVVLVVFIILAGYFMVKESGYGKLTVKNNTNINLEFLKTSFVNGEGTVDKGLQTGSISANDTLKSDMEPVNLTLTESNLEVRFKFENSKEMFTDVGFFNENFKGNITVTFDKTKDPNIITIKIKASNGMFQTRNLRCDEKYDINLSEGEIMD